MENYLDKNNLEYKVGEILTAAPSGSFVSAKFITPTSGLMKNTSIQYGNYGNSYQYIDQRSAGYHTTNNFSDTNNYLNLNLNQNNPTFTPYGTGNIEANSFGNAIWNNLNIGSSHYDYKVNVTGTAPYRPLFVDNCSLQFFTQTGMMQEFNKACGESNLTCVATYPNLVQEYQNNYITPTSPNAVLFEYGWTILKTPFTNNFSAKNAGETEIIDSMVKYNLAQTSFILTDDSRALSKCLGMEFNAVNSWDFVLFMISKKIIEWKKAELIFKKFTTYHDPKYQNLRDYYEKNKKEINKKIIKLKK